jgi:hypothetical protein
MSPGLVRFAGWMMLAAWAPAGRAQLAGPAAAAGAAAAPASASGGATNGAGTARAKSPAEGQGPVRRINLRFSDERPVLGLPLGSSQYKAHCSIDGTAFYDPTANAAMAGQEMLGVAPDGGVKHVLRKLPIDFTTVTVRDFFAGDRQLATLLEGQKRDEGTSGSPARETDYFLSLEDEAGDLSDLVPLALRFKPVKIARFGSGDVVVLGWDEGNLLPVLAFVGGDGTVHRFIDLDVRSPDVTSEAAAAKAAAEHTRDTLEMLQGASFVAFGSDVLLTYPGTTKPVRVLNPAGETRLVPITIPVGYVLNDVLVSNARGTMVVRVKRTDDRKSTAPDAGAKMRLLEEDANHGSLIRELIPDKPAVEDVTCAVNWTVSAVFLDTIPDANANVLSGSGAAAATQLVIATARR